MPSNCCVDISGILWLVQRQLAGKRPLMLSIMDGTGVIQVHSWHHTAANFQLFVGQPCLFFGVRVRQIGRQKVAVLVVRIGDMRVQSGSVWQSGAFAGSNQLDLFWQSAAAARYRSHPAHLALLECRSAAAFGAALIITPIAVAAHAMENSSYT